MPKRSRKPKPHLKLQPPDIGLKSQVDPSQATASYPPPPSSAVESIQRLVRSLNYELRRAYNQEHPNLRIEVYSERVLNGRVIPPHVTVTFEVGTQYD